MDNLENVNKLIGKFRTGSLSPAEAQELSAWIKKGADHPDLNRFLEENWQQAEIPAEQIPSERMAMRLQEQISRETAEPEMNARKSFLRLLQPILRYAALVLITAGLTWLVMHVGSRNGVPADKDLSAVPFSEIHVPYGSKTRVVLPDGSEVTLNSGSYLRYPATFDSLSRYAFIQGEAFFDIHKNARHPFIVKTNDITIKVLGTKFNVKSYTDEKTVETTLVSGSIEIYGNQKLSAEKSPVLLLKPNQQAIFEKQTGTIAIAEKERQARNQSIKPIKPFLVNKKVDVDPVIAWKDNRLIFRDESFATLSTKLERWYNVDIEIRDPELSSALFSGIFEKETVEQALNALRIATPFDYKMNKNTIIIFK